MLRLAFGPLLATSFVVAPLHTIRAQEAYEARELIERAAEAMGGVDRLLALDNMVMTGFGQRYLTNGNTSSDVNSAPKWQAVVDAERAFDFERMRAVNRERSSMMFPFALEMGHAWNRGATLQSGGAMLDHPLAAIRYALESGTELGPVSLEGGYAVIPILTGEAAPTWIALDPVTYFPYWSRRVTSSETMGDVAHTTYFTGYLPFDDVWLPSGLLTKIDWRDQETLMFQVDSYRLDLDELPEFPERTIQVGRREPSAVLEVGVEEVTDGVWDLDIIGGNPLADLGNSGGAVIEFEDRLILFEPYGSAEQTLARIDAANELVPGKEVGAVVVTHHHADHAAGVRAVVSRGIPIIAHRRNRALFEEWVSRPAVYFPDDLARSPKPLEFIPVDDRLVIEDSMRRLEVYHVVGHLHMSDAVFGYLPEEKIIMEGDFSDENYMFNWWAGAFRANMERYDIAPETDVPVHGEVASIDAKFARIAEQVETAREFCEDHERRGAYVFGCPVRFSADEYIAD